MSPSLLWFRRDLRLRDNPALAAALRRGGPVIPIFIRDDDGEGDWSPGGASRWWLHHSLLSLDASLRLRGSRLVLARGDSDAILRKIIKFTGAGAIFWNRCHEPAAARRDRDLQTALRAAGLQAESFNAALLFEPDAVRNKSGGPFQVFTPFWRHCQTLPVASPIRLRAGRIAAPRRWPASIAIQDLELLPASKWDEAFPEIWQPGEGGAQKYMRRFTGVAMDDYSRRRDFPSDEGTSALSPYLHFGEIGPREIWAAVRARARDSGVFPPSRGAQVFLTELGWREFAHHLLVHFPQTPREPLRRSFAAFPWRDDAAALRAWQRGATGYPIVDAGMRQLWRTGWMHNRVRMIVASFLVKHLRISWREGAAWFWDTLVDADLANNTLGWQWSAGCGADAAPYFRIFNPMRQGRKFDPAGRYVRRWVPELAKLPAKFIHEPWVAPVGVLRAAEVVLGRDYPRPVVRHEAARAAALAAFKSIGRIEGLHRPGVR